jgi:hypothetical protein
MLRAGLLGETVELLRAGRLRPGNTCFQRSRLVRDEAAAGRRPAAASVGWSSPHFVLKLSLGGPAGEGKDSGGKDVEALEQDNEEQESLERFQDFVGRFCTVSRQYSTEQMKWFRRDTEYRWVRAELGEEDPLRGVAEMVVGGYRSLRSEWEQQLSARCDAAVREANVAEAKAMRSYRPAATVLQMQRGGGGEGAAAHEAAHTQLRRWAEEGEKFRAELRALEGGDGACPWRRQPAALTSTRQQLNEEADGHEASKKA